jgi:hypothetical protein
VNTCDKYECVKAGEIDAMLARVVRVENYLFGCNGNNGLNSRLVKLEQRVGGWYNFVEKIIYALIGGISVFLSGVLSKYIGGI